MPTHQSGNEGGHREQGLQIDDDRLLAEDAGLSKGADSLCPDGAESVERLGSEGVEESTLFDSDARDDAECSDVELDAEYAETNEEKAPGYSAASGTRPSAGKHGKETRSYVPPFVTAGMRENLSYGRHGRQGQGGSSNATIPGFGISLRTLALIAAVAAAVAVVASFVVSCGMQGAIEGAVDSRQRSYEARMDEELNERLAQVDALIEKLEAGVAQAEATQENSEALSSAKAEVMQAISTAEEWLESGDGRWVRDQTQALMQSAITTAKNLVNESGITDPQTYKDAAAAIAEIIDAVQEGAMR